MILNSGAKSPVDDEDGKADVEDEPDLPVGVAIKRLRKVFEVHACMLFFYSLPPVRESGFRNRGKIWNLRLWNPEYSSRSPESHQRLESDIQESEIQGYLRFPCME